MKEGLAVLLGVERNTLTTYSRVAGQSEWGMTSDTSGPTGTTVSATASPRLYGCEDEF